MIQNKYICDNTSFINKKDALLYSQTLNKPVSWWCENEYLSTLNWKHEPENSIDDLYVKRARQLREKYDYLVVMLSGGMDSTNIVETFLNNNIKIDEIVAGIPKSGLKNWTPDKNDLSATNYASEFFLVLIPYCRELLRRYPKIKITENDYFANVLAYKEDEWLHESRDFLSPITPAQFNLSQIDSIRKMVEAGKKVGVVYGVDKPKLAVSDDRTKVYSVIVDTVFNSMTTPYFEKYDNVDMVYFYYNTDVPEIMIKGAHMSARFLAEDSSRHYMFGNWNKNLNQRQKHIINSDFQRIIRPTLYPSTFVERFQVAKCTQKILSEYDSWVYRLHGNIFSDLYGQIENYIRQFSHDVVKDRTGFPAYFHIYHIGDFKDFTTK